MPRVFEGLASFSRACAEMAELQPRLLAATAGLSATILKRKAQSIFGSPEYLASLAQATQDERARLGYAPNEPLLRDGTLLRASVEGKSASTGEQAIAGTGSKEPIMGYHEHGYVNARTGRPVPPRPVFKIALVESAPEVRELLQRTVRASLELGALAGVEEE
jgi:hypothetical protein